MKEIHVYYTFSLVVFVYFLKTKFQLNILNQTWILNLTRHKSNLGLHQTVHICIKSALMSSRLQCPGMLGMRSFHMIWHRTVEGGVYMYCLSKQLSNSKHLPPIYTKKVTIIFFWHPILACDFECTLKLINAFGITVCPYAANLLNASK